MPAVDRGPRSALTIAGAVVLLHVTSAWSADPARTVDNAAQTALFRETVEPLLREKCFDCHSHEAGDASGGLMLDSRSGWEIGGDHGPAVVPGKPEESLLVKAIDYREPKLQMPPDGKLTADEIAVLTNWIRSGAFDPRRDDSGPVKATIDLDAGREFWSYRPVARVTPPNVVDSNWPRNTIDRFILARLEAKGFAPAADADRAVLARRLYFDLTGLPPSPQEIDAFVHDRDPQAYEKLVERLLASPAFGERWGRHWLDLARYAESVTLRGLVFNEAWRYRDYVIDAFNRDVPLDVFIREQVAGDLLPAETPADRARQLVATTYLTLGNTNLEEQDKVQLRMDVVDEQLDVIGKGLLAQTITCARCHDHKFDPIPTRDYYALAGILRNSQTLIEANVSNWIEVPLPASPEIEQAVAAHQQQVADLEAQIAAAKKNEPTTKDGRPLARGALSLTDVPGIVVDDVVAMKVGEWKESTFSGNYIGRGYSHDLNTDKGQKTITFEPDLPASGRYEVWIAYDFAAGRASDVPVTIFSAQGETSTTLDMDEPPPFGGRFTSLGEYRFEKDGQSFVRLSNEGTSGHLTPDLVTFIPAAERQTAEKRFPLPSAVTTTDTAETVASLQAQLKKVKAAAPYRPMAMSVREDADPQDTAVHIRGSVHSLGEIVPRGMLQVACNGPAAVIPEGESGRRELADWIASSDNPLTARVYVNRLWHWLFGAGLVRTVDNFGTTGEEPSHPELLDELAVRFTEGGWSTKTLIREIVLSRTYRQSIHGDPRAVAADPENRLFGRANRRRLDAETIRDAMLVISGELSACDGGRMFKQGLASDYGFSTEATCRSVYLPVFRNALPEIFEAFDFADPSVVTGRRTVSTIPQQALFMMNNAFVVEQADAAAQRLMAGNHSPNEAVSLAWQAALGRTPTAAERQTIGEFLAEDNDRDATAWARVYQVLFASPEFRYIE